MDDKTTSAAHTAKTDFGLVCFTTDGSIPPISNGALATTCSPLK